MSPRTAIGVPAAAILVLFGTAAPLDPNLTNVFEPRRDRIFPRAEPHGEAGPRSRTAGEDIATAIPIPGLPFYDAGNTCAFLDDYDEVCPYTGSTAPDVVYALPGWSAGWVHIRLCSSGYDTKVFVYENEWPNLVACNDDACGSLGWRSEILTLPLTAGSTYYVVVDGYGGDCGEYDLEIGEVHVEIVACPPGAVLEGEEDCHDGWGDELNGGCNAFPDPLFSPLVGTPDGSPFDLCGTSGTYLVEGMQHRDTDWYEFHVTEPDSLTFWCVAEFPLRVFFLDGNEGCGGVEVLATATAGPVPDGALLTYNFDPGVYWYWVGPDVFTGVPCGSDYAVTIWGLRCGAVSASARLSAATWGSAKGRYR